MNEASIAQIIEAALLVAGRPLDQASLATLFLADEAVSDKQIIQALETLQAQWQQQRRGVQLQRVASGWRVQAVATLAPRLWRLFAERPVRYSRATLETLALIAYRQPITRAQIEDVRGVVVSSQIMRNLQERGWIRVSGQRESPGRPALYVTTKSFLDDFNLTDLAQLPALPDSTKNPEMIEP